MNTSTSLLAYPELVSEIQRLSSSKQSGTIFITSEDCHLARVVLNEGEISSLFFDSKQKGHDALELIQTIKSGRLQFAKDLFENSEEVPLPATEDILQNLNGTSSEKSSPTTKIGNAIELVKKVLAVYIGPFAIIACEEYLEEHTPLETKEAVGAMINTIVLEIDNKEDKELFLKEIKALLNDAWNDIA